MVVLGIESFIKDKRLQSRLKNRRVAFLGHSASVSQKLKHSLSLIQSETSLNISCVIGPQHGFKGLEQANMITTEDEKTVLSFALSEKGQYFSQQNKQENHKTPVFSLYSNKTRRLTLEMLSSFDVLIVDLQDVGCRVYTYLTTLFYVLEDCAKAKKEVWVLDRPNPAGRGVEGILLKDNFKSFVGAGPLPLRHGLTLGEATLWYRDLKKLNLSLEVIKLKNYQPEKEAWPKGFPWVVPSPNMVDEECARCYGGTVLLEGTNISEGRGTVFPLKVLGFPKMQAQKVLKAMTSMAHTWLKGCVLREEFFQPVFDKFQNQVCSALRIYAIQPFYNPREFSPLRLTALFLKCVREVHPEKDWLKPPPYEYEYEKWPLDILSGDDFLRKWIADPHASTKDLEEKLSIEEQGWKEQRKNFLLY